MAQVSLNLDLLELLDNILIEVKTRAFTVIKDGVDCFTLESLVLVGLLFELFLSLVRLCHTRGHITIAFYRRSIAATVAERNWGLA